MKPRPNVIRISVLVVFAGLFALAGALAELSPERETTDMSVPREAGINPARAGGIMQKQSENPAIRWFYAPAAAAPRGVALVIHGLNLRPDKMQSVIAHLTASGIDVCRLSLRGHGDNYDHLPGVDGARARMQSFRQVSYGLWINEVYLGWLQVQKRARRADAPRFLVGYSLGALLGLDLFASRSDVHFERMVLLAPAVKLYSLFYLERFLSPFPGLIIPSLLAPRDYLSNPTGTPVAAFNALFDALAHFEKHVSPRINAPTLVFIDPGDEFIPLWGLKNLIRDQHLDRWKLYIVKKDKEAFGRYHHHMIDAYSTGRQEWQKMMAAAVDHLLERPAESSP